jgi:hypothetical protein
MDVALFVLVIIFLTIVIFLLERGSVLGRRDTIGTGTQHTPGYPPSEYGGAIGGLGSDCGAGDSGGGGDGGGGSCS